MSVRICIAAVLRHGDPATRMCAAVSILRVRGGLPVILRPLPSMRDLARVARGLGSDNPWLGLVVPDTGVDSGDGLTNSGPAFEPFVELLDRDLRRRLIVVTTSTAPAAVVRLGELGLGEVLLLGKEHTPAAIAVSLFRRLRPGLADQVRAALPKGASPRVRMTLLGSLERVRAGVDLTETALAGIHGATEAVVRVDFREAGLDPPLRWCRRLNRLAALLRREENGKGLRDRGRAVERVVRRGVLPAAALDVGGHWPPQDPAPGLYPDPSWVGEHRSRAIREAIRLGCSPDDAEDVAQVTLLRLYDSKSGRWREQVTPGYVTRVAANVARDFWRRSASQDSFMSLMISEAHRSSPERFDHLEGAERKQAVRRAIRSLSEPQATAMWLRWVVGWEGRQIGELLGITPGATRVMLHRGRKAVAERLSGSLA